MLEYAFFHQAICDRFLAFVRERGIAARVARGELSIDVSLPEELEGGLLEEVEAYYDQLLEMTEAATAAEEGAAHVSKAGITLDLADGRSILAPVEPALLNKLLTVVTMGELSAFVHAIVDAVENPDARPLCKR